MNMFSQDNQIVWTWMCIQHPFDDSNNLMIAKLSFTCLLIQAWTVKLVTCLWVSRAVESHSLIILRKSACCFLLINLCSKKLGSWFLRSSKTALIVAVMVTFSALLSCIWHCWYFKRISSSSACGLKSSRKFLQTSHRL